MSMRTIVVLVLSVVCGLAAAISINRLRHLSRDGVEGATNVVVARTDIPRGQTVTEEMVKVVPWPSDLAPAHALSKVEEAVNRAAAIPILKGDVVLEAKMAGKDAGRGVAALVPPGMRAYTIQTLKVASNVAGFVLPGNRVDVLLTVRGFVHDEAGGGTSTTLLQAVEILAVNQSLEPPAENKVDTKEMQSVTLLVTPQQAELLDLGQNLGVLALSLRNPTDREELTNDPATLAGLLRLKSKIETASNANRMIQETKKPVVGNPPVMRIRTLRGSTPGEVLVDRN